MCRCNAVVDVLLTQVGSTPACSKTDLPMLLVVVSNRQPRDTQVGQRKPGIPGLRDRLTLCINSSKLDSSAWMLCSRTTVMLSSTARATYSSSGRVRNEVMQSHLPLHHCPSEATTACAAASPTQSLPITKPLLNAHEALGIMAQTTRCS